jgi:hypothetical protein
VSGHCTLPPQRPGERRAETASNQCVPSQRQAHAVTAVRARHRQPGESHSELDSLFVLNHTARCGCVESSISAKCHMMVCVHAPTTYLPVNPPPPSVQLTSDPFRFVRLGLQLKVSWGGNAISKARNLPEAAFQRYRRLHVIVGFEYLCSVQKHPPQARHRAPAYNRLQPHSQQDAEEQGRVSNAPSRFSPLVCAQEAQRCSNE